MSVSFLIDCLWIGWAKNMVEEFDNLTWFVFSVCYLLTASWMDCSNVFQIDTVDETDGDTH